MKNLTKKELLSIAKLLERNSKSSNWTKQDYMNYWVGVGYENRKKWDKNPTKPLRTETWCDYLYDFHWKEMKSQGLTRNDIFYGMRFPINRFKKDLK